MVTNARRRPRLPTCTAHLFRGPLATPGQHCYCRPVSDSQSQAQSRHVGRVVDPDVLDDGSTEPRLELGAEPAPLPAESAASAIPPVELEGERPEVTLSREPAAPEPGAAPQVAAESLPVAAARDPSLGLSGLDELIEPEPQVRGPQDAELELVGTAPIALPGGSLAGGSRRLGLSPNLLAVFGTLLGLLTVATLIAVAGHLDRRYPTPPWEVPSSVASVTVSPTAPSLVETPKPKRVRVKLLGPWRLRDAASDPAMRLVEGQVGSEPFIKAAEKAGLSTKDAYRLVSAFEAVRPLKTTSRTDRFVALLERVGGRLKAFEYLPNAEEVYQAKEGAGGVLAVAKLDLQVKRERVTGAFLVTAGGLESAVSEGGFEKPLVRALAEALTGHASLDELDKGTRVRVVAQEVTLLGEFSRYAGVETVELAFPGDRKSERVYFFNGAHARGYFDAAGRSPYEGGWRKPIPTAPITSHFNPKRFHPVLKRIMPHTGTDFGAPTGTPIGASSYGTLAFIGPSGPNGNFIKITHPGGIETGYSHMSRFAEGLKVGDKVRRLQLIGYVGSTGRSTGPHLHFSAKRDGKFIDAETLNLDGMRTLPSEDREAFNQEKATLDQLLEAIPLPEVAPSVAVLEPMAAAPAASVAGPATPAPGNSTPSPAASNARGAVYLTDDELKKLQGGSDDGEVSE